MARFSLRFAVAVVAVWACWSSSGFPLDVPPLTGRIVDAARLLPSDRRESLSEELADYERRSGNQIAVLILPSLEGEPLEDYSHRVATTWKLGQRGRDNGVLLLVVSQDRRIRIEVGYGLEGKLTDAVSSRIIRHAMAPYFRAGDFAAGIKAGLDAVIGALEEAGVPPGTPRPPAAPEPGGAWSVVAMAVVLGALIGVMIGRSLRLLAGAVSGVLSFFMAVPSGFFLALAAGAVGMMAAFLLAALSGGGRSSRRWNGGWGPGWGGGYGGGGFPSSSDTFSGGGGDFGGGGASGRW